MSVIYYDLRTKKKLLESASGKGSALMPCLGELVTIPDDDSLYKVAEITHNFRDSDNADVVYGLYKRADEVAVGHELVLDLAKDPYAQQAAKVYADAIERSNPKVANSVRVRLDRCRKLYKNNYK